jgi:two-component system invasion response regulator UvrY
VPGAHGIGMISDFRKVSPEVRILIHSGMDEKTYALQFLSAGANGFVSKLAEFSTVTEAIKMIMRGKNYVSPVTQGFISDKFFKGATKEGSSENDFNLTLREKEVTKLLLKGKWTKEIADELGLKLTTISTHKGRIFEKFNVENSIELYIKIQKEIPWLLDELN